MDDDREREFSRAVEAFEERHRKRVRFWFEDLQAVLRSKCGEEDWIWVAAAWAALQQQRDMPVENMRMVLTSHQALKAGKELRDLQALGGGEDAAAFLKRQPLRKYTAYIADFTDVLLGKSTRSCMGDDPRGGRPAPIDIWAFRDMGYVDLEYRQFLIRRFGESQAARLKIDDLGEAQYEWAVKKYGELADLLNKKGTGGATGNRTKHWPLECVM